MTALVTNQYTTTKEAAQERLVFTVFVAVAAHALLIIGVTFSLQLAPKTTPALEITIAAHKSNRAPDQADYLAQFDQEASGTEDQARQLTTDQHSEISASKTREIAPPPQLKKSSQLDDRQQLITTTRESRFKIDTPELNTEKNAEPSPGNDEFTTPLSQEIATLRARLDQQKQSIARRPRVKRLTSVATKSSTDAAYLAEWTRRVESVGRANFPQQAVDQGVVGSLRMVAILRSDGSLYDIEVTQSSGHPILDSAAEKIARLASPFQPFPDEILEEADHLEIIRTWSFTLSGLKTSAE